MVTFISPIDKKTFTPNNEPRDRTGIHCIPTTKARDVENSLAASSRGSPKLLRLESHTKSQRNARNSLKVD